MLRNLPICVSGGQGQIIKHEHSTRLNKGATQGFRTIAVLPVQAAAAPDAAVPLPTPGPTVAAAAAAAQTPVPTETQLPAAKAAVAGGATTAAFFSRRSPPPPPRPPPPPPPSAVPGYGITYHLGGPVMTKNPVKIYNIFYGTWKNKFGIPNQKANVLTSLARSIGGSPWYNIQNSYSDGVGKRIPNAVCSVWPWSQRPSPTSDPATAFRA